MKTWDELEEVENLEGAFTAEQEVTWELIKVLENNDNNVGLFIALGANKDKVDELLTNLMKVIEENGSVTSVGVCKVFEEVFSRDEIDTIYDTLKARRGDK